jgi:RHS repeat-associated protein
MGKLVAEYSTAAPPQNPTTSYTATDQLDSPRVITDTNGNVTSRRDFMPFGEELAPDGQNRTTNQKYNTGDNIRQKFTGYQKDTETQLDFAEARMYENRHGRFTAVDPLLASGKSANPQTFNRYVYCLNNPLVFTDPSGLQTGRWVTQRRDDGNDYLHWSTENISGNRESPITERNKAGDLIARSINPDWVYRLNPNGPMPEETQRSLIMMNRIATPFEIKGYELIRSDEYLAWCIEKPCDARMENVTLDLFFALEGLGGLFKFGVRGVGKGIMEAGVEGGSGSGENLLLRTMKVGEDGLPVTGQSATTLGARVPKDIVPGEGGIVQPGTGGMSVTPKGGQLPSMGGKNLETFCIKCRDLGPNLSYRPDPARLFDHGFIEPGKAMTVEQYQQYLMETQPFWQIYIPN